MYLINTHALTHQVQMVQLASWHDPPSTQLIKTSFSSQSKTLKVSQQNPKKNSIIITQHTSTHNCINHMLAPHTHNTNSLSLSLSLSLSHDSTATTYHSFMILLQQNLPLLHDSTATQPTGFLHDSTPATYHSTNLVGINSATGKLASWFHCNNLLSTHFLQPSRYNYSATGKLASLSWFHCSNLDLPNLSAT
jgi:hypothetical protein